MVRMYLLLSLIINLMLFYYLYYLLSFVEFVEASIMFLHNLLNVVLLNSITGKLQVQLALAYVTCCPGGISEAELEDTLSIDDVFLNTVFQVRMLIMLLK